MLSPVQAMASRLNPLTAVDERIRPKRDVLRSGDLSVTVAPEGMNVIMGLGQNQEGTTS